MYIMLIFTLSILQLHVINGHVLGESLEEMVRYDLGEIYVGCLVLSHSLTEVLHQQLDALLCRQVLVQLIDSLAHDMIYLRGLGSRLPPWWVLVLASSPEFRQLS